MYIPRDSRIFAADLLPSPQTGDRSTKQREGRGTLVNGTSLIRFDHDFKRRRILIRGKLLPASFRFLSPPFSYSFLLLMPLIRLESPRPQSEGFFTFEASKKFPRVGKCNVVCARQRWNSLELARKESSCVFWP